MNIQQAATLAFAKGTTMYRENNPPGWEIKPTHARDTLTCSIHAREEAPRWQPTLDDLLADDWRVTE